MNYRIFPHHDISSKRLGHGQCPIIAGLRSASLVSKSILFLSLLHVAAYVSFHKYMEYRIEKSPAEVEGVAGVEVLTAALYGNARNRLYDVDPREG